MQQLAEAAAYGTPMQQQADAGARPEAGPHLRASRKASRWGQSLAVTMTSAARQLCPQLCVLADTMLSAWYSRSRWVHLPGTTMQGVTHPSSAATGLVRAGVPVCSSSVRYEISTATAPRQAQLADLCARTGTAVHVLWLQLEPNRAR